MKVAEVAAYLHVHRATIYRLIDRGLLRPFKVGRVWRFDRRELTALQSGARVLPREVERRSV